MKYKIKNPSGIKNSGRAPKDGELWKHYSCDEVWMRRDGTAVCVGSVSGKRSNLGMVVTISDYSRLYENHKDAHTSIIIFDDDDNAVQESFKTVRLSAEYEAQIHRDKIVVGCQTITPDTFDKVAKAFAEIRA
jgi:hypothetical protein